ncbi:MAG: penicillin-binding protein 1B [SAR86 cluster bacterium]|nr:penicillin-binding protein 1B [SAR86 cluster bacterium]
MNLINSNIKKILITIVVLAVFISILFLSVLDIKVRDKFETALWTIPAKVYARSLDISEGTYLNKNIFVKELEIIGYKKTYAASSPGDYSIKNRKVEVFLKGFDNQYKKQDKGKFIIAFSKKGKVLSIKREDGIFVDFISLEPLAIGGMYPSHMEDRMPLEWSDVPQELIDIIVSVEDQDFFNHKGFSFKAITRALFRNLRATSVVEGGSTITQQLTKSLFFSPEQTLTRKIMELIVSLLIEIHYSKEEILLAYINDVHLSQVGNRSINGFGLASEHFFGTSIKSLDLDQMALLVGMLKGPSIYNPRRFPERAKKRRDLVLSILNKSDVFSTKRIELELSKPISVIRPRYGSKTKYPAFQDLVRLDLRNQFSDKELRVNGLQVHTNIEPVTQEIAQKNLTLTLKELNQKYKQNLNDLQSAVVIIKVGSGEIVSLVGSSNPNNFGFNRALNAFRPMGSLMKPVVYLAALKRHDQYNLNTIIDDSKLIVSLPEGGAWEPNNFDGEFHGKIPMHEALWQSYNIATARIGMDIGVDVVLEDLYELGYTKKKIPLPSYLIGSIEMSPLEIAEIYQTLASDGFHTELRAVSYVSDLNNNNIWVNQLKLQQRFRSEDIHLLKFPLRQLFERGTARGYSKDILDKWNAGGKTGTSNDQRDSWFAGYAGDYLVIVWLGFDDNRKTPLTGRSGALQVWKAIIEDLNPLAQRSAIPKRIKYLWVNIKDGLLSGENCKNSVYMPFISGFEPKRVSLKSKNCMNVLMPYKTKIYKKINKIMDGLSEN